MRLKTALFGCFLALSASAASSEGRVYRDVYLDVCTQAARECRWDWGKGACTRATSIQFKQVVEKNERHGGGDGGGTNLPVCMMLGPVYGAKRASPVPDTRIINVAIYNKKTGEIIATRWIGKDLGGSEGGN